MTEPKLIKFDLLPIITKVLNQNLGFSLSKINIKNFKLYIELHNDKREETENGTNT